MVEMKKNRCLRLLDDELAHTGELFNAAIVQIAVEGLH